MPPHTGSTCAKYHEWLKLNSKSDLAFEELLENRGWKRWGAMILCFFLTFMTTIIYKKDPILDIVMIEISLCNVYKERVASFFMTEKVAGKINARVALLTLSRKCHEQLKNLNVHRGCQYVL
jgi:hypothetical protein